MSGQRLEELVQELHREMESRQLDEADREQLRLALADVSGHLLGDGDDDVVADRLREAYARFQVDHPALAAGLQRLIQTLDQSGI